MIWKDQMDIPSVDTINMKDYDTRSYKAMIPIVNSYAKYGKIKTMYYRSVIRHRFVYRLRRSRKKDQMQATH